MRTTEHKDLKQSAFLDLKCFCESGPYSGCYSGSSVEMREKRFHSIFNKGEKEFMSHNTHWSAACPASGNTLHTLVQLELLLSY